jgi:hypothetical protein
MAIRHKIADEQATSLGGWLFADLFLLIMVIGLAGFTFTKEKVAPNVTTGEVKNIAATSALITGIIDAGDEPASAFFKWGTNSGLGGDAQVTAAEESPIAIGKVGAPMTALLEDLEPSTTYYFQANGESKAGSDAGEIRSFRTSDESDGPCSNNPRFVKTPFEGTYTKSRASEKLKTDIEKWISEQQFVQPKVAVAFITGWSNNPAGSDGARRARDFYATTMTKYASSYFDANTAVRAIQRSENLADFNFEVQLYFVETANQCK